LSTRGLGRPRSSRDRGARSSPRSTLSRAHFGEQLQPPVRAGLLQAGLAGLGHHRGRCGLLGRQLAAPASALFFDGHTISTVITHSAIPPNQIRRSGARNKARCTLPANAHAEDRARVKDQGDGPERGARATVEGDGTGARATGPRQGRHPEARATARGKRRPGEGQEARARGQGEKPGMRRRGAWFTAKLPGFQCVDHPAAAHTAKGAGGRSTGWRASLLTQARNAQGKVGYRGASDPSHREWSGTSLKQPARPSLRSTRAALS
jgi:hypothetical protein